MAAVLLAGGQGTRLGFDGPKGLFPFAPISGRTLFAHHAAKIEALRARYGAALPWYILTSPQNDEATRAAFADAGWFGLDPASVRLVVQGTLPAVDRESGQILLDAPDRLALSPDGHGGLLSALRASGALDGMAAEGIRTIFTFQVDNPMARVCNPELLGHHALAEAEMASVVVRKVAPEEKMGVIARVDGRTGVVEYSDLPDDLAQRRDDGGELVYWAGSIAVHCLQVEFARRLTEGGLQLPYHRAEKRVPYVDDAGATDRAGCAERRQVRDLPLRRPAVRAAHGDGRGRARGRVLADQERARVRLAANRPPRPQPSLRAVARGGGHRGAGRARRRAGRPRDRPAHRPRGLRPGGGAAGGLSRGGPDGDQAARGQPVTIG